MNQIATRLSASFFAAVASAVVLGSVLGLFAHAGDAGATRHPMPGGAGVAERYRAMQATANDQLLAPRAGVTDFRAQPGASAGLIGVGPHS